MCTYAKSGERYPRYDGEKIHGWRSRSVQRDLTIKIGFRTISFLLSKYSPKFWSLALYRSGISIGGRCSYAAADRTLMAWIRTSLSLIGFGFGIPTIVKAIAISTKAPTLLKELVSHYC